MQFKCLIRFLQSWLSIFVNFRNDYQVTLSTLCRSKVFKSRLGLTIEDLVCFCFHSKVLTMLHNSLHFGAVAKSNLSLE